MTKRQMIGLLSLLCRTINSGAPIKTAGDLDEFMICLDQACDFIATHDDPPEPTTNTVHVRIAVIVDGRGNVGAYGVSKNVTDKDAMVEAYEYTYGGPEGFSAQAFIEADIPRISTVQGRVVETKA